MQKDDVEIVRTTTWSAGPGCHGGCGVLAHIKDGRLVKIEGDPDHPWSHGRLCARVLAMTQYVENEKRLRKPLKRVGKRGEGKWEEISWDEAFDLIEKKMKKIREEYGPESVIFSMGTGRDISAWICMLAYAYGSPNVMFSLSGNACYSPRIAAVIAVQGDFTVFDAAQWLSDRYDDPRYEVPECMIVWGYNIHGTCPDNLFGHWIIDLMKRGTKLITIDPRLSWFASRSKHWLQIRPGSDSALAMGFLNVMINEDLYNHEFLEKWTNGSHLIRKDTGKLLRESDLARDGSFNNFAVWDIQANKVVIWESDEAGFKGDCAKAMISGECTVTLADGSEIECMTAWDVYCEEVNKYPLEKVEEITGIPAEDIAKAARSYANAKPGALHWGVPIDMTPAVTPLCQAIAAMWALTGNLDIPGGNVISKYAFDVVAYALPGADGAIKLRREEMDEPRIGRDKYMPFNKFCWRCQTDLTIEQIFTEKPYPIKGMWLQTCNPLAGIGLDPEKWRKAFEKLDFIAVVDLFHTPTTQYADIVLPAATFLEKDSFRSWWVPLQAISKAMQVDECMSDIDINLELSKRFDPEFEFESVNELFDYILKPSGMTFEELKEKGYAIPPEGSPSAPYNRYQRGLLRSDGKPGFKTPTGLFELYSTLREEWDLEPMPHHEEPPYTPVSRPDLAKDYPLILSTGRRSPAFFHSEHRMIPWLRNIDPDPIVEINPGTAKKYGIGNGEWIWIENWQGRAKYKAKLTWVVPDWMIMATHGWWFPEKKAEEPSLYGVWEHNINLLLPMGEQGKDGMGSPIKHSMCKIYKADGKEG
jgi:anaerobic selenocysteine-containing dehydrogenase